MDYNNPEFHTGERAEEQAGSGEYHSSEANSYGTYSEMPLNGNPNMNFAGQQNMGNYQQQRKEGTDVLAVISLVMGILSLVCCCMGFGVLFGIAGIILGGISIANRGGKGVAIGGLVTSIIGTVFSLIVIIYVVFVYSTVMSNPDFKDIMENVQDGTYDYYNDYPFEEDWMDGFY